MAEILDGNDICECGDYRSSHENATGACVSCIRRWGIGFCQQFRKAFHTSDLTGDTRPSKDELGKAINESGLV